MPNPPQEIQLSQVLADVSKAGRATIIFGAGVSVAMAGSKAKWEDFLNRLVNSISKKHLAKHKRSGSNDHWLGQEALAHRLHTIRSLTHGDADAAAAATYLIDRVHAVLDGGAGSTGRNEEVNSASYEVETDWLAGGGSPKVQQWNRLLRKLGDLARAGKAFLITTNFDHCIARAANLPIFVGGWALASNRKFNLMQDRQDGVVIQAHRTGEKTAWTDSQITQSNNEGISPYIHNQAWKKPGSVPSSWWPRLASVFHVHGSRLVTPSIVFDAASYSMLDSSTQILKSSEILRNLLSQPKARGPVIFVGCKGTLLDPHFITYWNKPYNVGGSYIGTSGQTVTVLQKEDDIDPLIREMHGHSLLFPPAFCSYGADYPELPIALEQIAAAL